MTLSIDDIASMAGENNLAIAQTVNAALELEQLAARGISRAAITLHVGPGTFLPVRVEDVDQHKMWPERFEVPADPGGRQPEQAAQRGGGHRAPLGHRSEDSRTGARLLLGMPFGRLDNHNVSMS